MQLIDLETIHTITSILSDIILIIAGIYALHTFWVVAKWYKEKLEELKKIEDDITFISQSMLEQQSRKTMSKGYNMKRKEEVDQFFKDEEEVRNKNLEILREKRKFILEKLPFVEWFRK